MRKNRKIAQKKSIFLPVFNDGDEKELRRTQLVLKGGKHFAADGNLDSMPLTNPESFSTPVIRGAAKRGAQKMCGSFFENLEKLVQNLYFLDFSERKYHI